ncbi:uncharacterized protein LOC131939799 isoform X2 [Physella acuta]|uniref:uncharacterized protein LOC131939799 isoform X2 n=1 Tax=Physella acuta TaxID=109671 RepID=UPI0027DCB5A4|nr:uncharacterized protein LOC131939799 isoform X2 [Physella acuta]
MQSSKKCVSSQTDDLYLPCSSSQTDDLYLPCSINQHITHKINFCEVYPILDEKSNVVLQTPCQTQPPSRSPLIPATAAVAEDASLFVMDGLQAKEKSVLHSLNDNLHSDADIRRAVDTDDDRHTEDSSKSSTVTNISSVN